MAKSIIERIDIDFHKDLRDSMITRLSKGLAKFKPEALSISEATHLIRRTSGWQQVLNELKTKPKKENIFK